MIKVIAEIYAKSFDDAAATWQRFDIVRGKATLKIESSRDDAGVLYTYELEATLLRPVPSLHDNLSLRIYFDEFPAASVCKCREPHVLALGTSDLPVRLDIAHANTLVISCQYKTPPKR